ncbi:type I polyketide synthase, partial [Streptomyces sp. NEAU-W12]|uniref:type I polyketide synthase n=1 Tax=Streptomyces sp. NEAU-W12 TaxID=2994668 RepID=UPI00224A4DCD|nr:SDR family NAD(P)-dependent oxidoreductase [Streptomyces sp. NEAU-W12]
RLSVSHAFHSPLMEPMLAEFRRVAESLTYAVPAIPVVSNVTGEVADPALLCSAEYWVRHVRGTVRFADGVRALAGAGVNAFLELGPDGVLTGMAARVLDGATDTVSAAALRKDRPEETALLTALARLHVTGVDIDWDAWFRGTGAQRVELPTYAFQREHYWPEPAAAPGSGAGQDPVDAAFWAAVEREDLQALSATLDLDDTVLSDVLPALSSWRRGLNERSLVDGWRYRVSWRPLTASDTATATTAPGSSMAEGPWLVLIPAVLDGDPWAEAVVGALGADAVRVVCAPDDAALAARLAEAADGTEYAGVVSLFAAVAANGGADRALLSGGAWPDALLDALDDAGIAGRLWAVTRGAVSVGRSDAGADPVQAAVWGLGRVTALERPDRWGGLVDLDHVADARTAERLRAVLTATGPDAEDQVALRASGAYGRRLVRAAAQRPDAPWRPTGTVLVTGGPEGFAGHVARWLAGNGATGVLLAVRGEADADALDALRAELAELETDFTVVAHDPADPSALTAAVDALPEGRPLTAVIHTGDDGVPAEGAGAPGADALLAAVRRDLDALDAATGDRSLDAFVVFGSISGVWGVSGQGAGAAAGAYLDTVAQERRTRGGNAVAVSWGAWAGAGPDGLAAHLRANGLPAMDPHRALTVLGAVVGDAVADPSAPASVTVADVLWDRFAPAFTRTRPGRLFTELPEVRRAPAAAGGDRADAGTADTLRTRLRQLDERDRLPYALDLVRTEVASVLGHAGADAVPADQAFKDLGFDSLTAVDLRNQLAAATGLTLPATLVFDYPTPTALAAHLLTGLLGEDTGPAAPAAYGTDAGAADDPIVIVGMSCRYPGGVRSPEDLWDLAVAGTDAIGAFPTDRGWDLDRLLNGDRDGRGRSVTRHGGFLYDVADFDPDFFGISPREALVIDPQQRIVLEAAWEALERAGIDPAGLRGGDTGVFVGGGSGDYRPAIGQVGHVETAQSASLLSGRLSYTLGLEGPSVSVDTACSSSLVALHLAAQALRNGECSVALAGGVTVMSTPVGFVEFGEMGALSPDGRCKAFSDDADGTAWAEGVGMLVVERLSDARRNGHQVLAVLRGSAVNQDGASNGLTAPNGPSQQRVIRKALTAAGLTAHDVDAVEAHGTGTALGDPIEAQALHATYGQDRDPQRPLLLGSLKSNLGHTQAASGVAGVIKMVMAMRHGTLPKTLHVGTPSSHVAWDPDAVRLLTEETAWPETGRPRRAGVSSFGASGTNAHVVLEQPTADADADGTAPVPSAEAATAGPLPVALSAVTRDALADQADRLRTRLTDGADPDAARRTDSVADLALSLGTTRSAFEHRAVLVAADRVELVDALTALAEDRTVPNVLRGRAAPGGRTAFLFPGQGSQRPGAGRGLYARYPVFAEALDAVAACLDPELDRPLREVMFAHEGTPEAALLDTTGYTQPALFALGVALYRLVESWGVRPDLLAGHSVGEIAAAHVAGVFTLEDACTVVAARARLMQALPAGGAMIAVRASEEEVATRLGDRMSLAAVNGPDAVVISGDEDAVTALAEEFTALGRKTRRLRVSHAFHSLHMDAMLQDFGRATRSVSYTSPTLPLVSNLTGETAAPERVCDPGYWVDHVRRAVRFGDGVRTLAARGATRYLELGPDGVLCSLAQDTFDALADDNRPAPAAVPALRTGRDEERSLIGAVARLHAAGQPLDWSALLDGTGARRVDLPTYAFRRRRFWPDAAPATPDTAPAADDGDAAFWSAVQDEDFDALAGDLGVDGESLSRVLPALRDWRRKRGDQSTVDGWRQRIAWRPLNRAATTGTPTGTWLAVLPAGHDDDPWTTEVLSLLGPATVRLEATAADRADLAARLRELQDAGVPFTGVVSLLALAGGHDPQAPGTPRGATLTTALLQALGDAGVDAPLWCLTRGAVAVSPGERVPAPLQAAVHGLGRVAALEYPHRWGGTVDLPETLDERSAQRFTAVLADPEGEDQLAVRPAAVFGRRLAAVQPGAPRDWQPTGTVLITGGTGALGAHVARRLAGAGARHLVLLSRSGPDAPGTGKLRAELAELGAEATLTACDTADRAALAAVLADIPGHAPLTGVVHTAGVLDDGVLDSLTPERFEAVFHAKVTGALLLDELTRDHDLDVFALFSSASAAVGNPGQGNYAAANAVLDALAERRRADGLPATSVAYGAWGGDGMAGDDRATALARRTGIRPLDPDLAVLALRQTVTGGDPVAVVADVDPERFVRAFTTVRPSSLLAEMPAYAALTAANTAGRDAERAAPGLRDRLARLPGNRRLQTVLTLVRERAADVLGHTGTDLVGPDRAFRDLGFDSLGAVELRNQLGAATGLTLSATLVFDHPTPAALAEHVLGELLPGDTPGGETTDENALRAVLASVSLDRLRELGVLEPLLKLAGRIPAAAGAQAEGTGAEDVSDASIDAMEVDDLVQAALNGNLDDQRD